MKIPDFCETERILAHIWQKYQKLSEVEKNRRSANLKQMEIEMEQEEKDKDRRLFTE